MRATLALFLCLFGAVLAVNFSIVGRDDWDMQNWWNNEPYNHAPGQGQGKNLFIIGDGVRSYVYNSTHTLLSFYDTTYGQINVTNPNMPVRHMVPLGFSHSSYATVPMSNGKPQSAQQNTPGAWMSILSQPNNDWLWSGGGFVLNGKFYSMQHHCYMKNGGEYCDTAYIIVVNNPFANPQKWNSEAKYTLPIIWDNLFKDSKFVYLRGQTNDSVRLGRYSIADFTAQKFDRIQCWNKPGAWGDCSQGNFQFLYTVPWLGNLMDTLWSPYLQKWTTVQATVCSMQLWTSDTVTGPWTMTKTFWEISGVFKDWVYCYQASAHPAFIASANAEEMAFTTNSMAGKPGAPDTIVDSAGHRRWIMSPFPVRATLKRSDDVSARSRATSLGPIRYGFDMMGSDVTTTKCASAFECQESCHETSGCVAFSYDNSGTGTCWLKNSTPKMTENLFRTSGILNGLKHKVKLQLATADGRPVSVDEYGVLSTKSDQAAIFLGTTHDDGTFTLQHNGRYVSHAVSEKLHATSSVHGDRETFWLEKQSNGLFTLFSKTSQKHVQTQKDGGLAIVGEIALEDCHLQLQVL